MAGRPSTHDRCWLHARMIMTMQLLLPCSHITDAELRRNMHHHSVGHVALHLSNGSTGQTAKLDDCTCPELLQALLIEV